MPTTFHNVIHVVKLVFLPIAYSATVDIFMNLHKEFGKTVG